GPDHHRDQSDEPPHRKPPHPRPVAHPRIPRRVPRRRGVRAARDRRRRHDRHVPRKAQPASAASATPRAPNTSDPLDRLGSALRLGVGPTKRPHHSHPYTPKVTTRVRGGPMAAYTPLP